MDSQQNNSTFNPNSNIETTAPIKQKGICSLLGFVLGIFSLPVYFYVVIFLGKHTLTWSMLIISSVVPICGVILSVIGIKKENKKVFAWVGLIFSLITIIFYLKPFLAPD